MTDYRTGLRVTLCIALLGGSFATPVIGASGLPPDRSTPHTSGIWAPPTPLVGDTKTVAPGWTRAGGPASELPTLADATETIGSVGEALAAAQWPTSGSTAAGRTAPAATVAVLRRIVGRGGWLVPLLLVGYSRYDDSDPLENETRAEIYDTVRSTPGTYYARLAEVVGVTSETIRYHGRILEEEGLVQTTKIRGRRRVYPATMVDAEKVLAAVLEDGTAATTLVAVADAEPATISELADALDRSPSTVSYHVDRLVDDGLLDRDRDGNAVLVRLDGDVQSLFAEDARERAPSVRTG